MKQLFKWNRFAHARYGGSALFALAFCAQSVWAQDLVGEYKWQDLADKLPAGATVVQIDGREALKIENTKDAPLQVNLLTIAKPKITAKVYELTGEVRYDDVQGDGFLELWNYFRLKEGASEEGAFSRTLDDSGPMGKIKGTSDWREFSLPFDSTGAPSGPTRLQFDLVLQGRGTVYVSMAKLQQLPKATLNALAYPNAWWNGPTTGTIFGWGGGLIGCLGGLCGWLAAKGRARGFVIAVLWALTGLGAICALGCLIAQATGQPFFVWGPMLLMAVLLCSICPVNARQFQRRYEELELRRMASMDASRA